MTIVSSDYMVDESQSSVEVCGRLTDIPAGGLECEVVATINTSDGPKASTSLYLYVYPKYIKYLQVIFSVLQTCQFTGNKDLLKGNVLSSSAFKVSKMFVVWSCVLTALDITLSKTWC